MLLEMQQSSYTTRPYEYVLEDPLRELRSELWRKIHGTSVLLEAQEYRVGVERSVACS